MCIRNKTFRVWSNTIYISWHHSQFPYLQVIKNYFIKLFDIKEKYQILYPHLKREKVNYLVTIPVKEIKKGPEKAVFHSKVHPTFFFRENRVDVLLPSLHMTSKQRCMDVKTTSIRWNDVLRTSFWRRMVAESRGIYWI